MTEFTEDKTKPRLKAKSTYVQLKLLQQDKVSNPPN